MRRLTDRAGHLANEAALAAVIFIAEGVVALVEVAEAVHRMRAARRSS